jgi:serine/threonine protein kinase
VPSAPTITTCPATATAAAPIAAPAPAPTPVAAPAHVSEPADSATVPPLHVALMGECDTVIALFAHVPTLMDALQQRDELQAELQAAKDGDDYTQAMVLGNKLDALQKRIKMPPLTEKDYHALPGKHAKLVKKVSRKCKALLRAKNMAALEPLAAKLEELKALVPTEAPSVASGEPLASPVSDGTGSSVGRVEQPAQAASVFTSNGVTITNLQDLYSAQSKGGLGAASVRLMLRGEFRSVNTGSDEASDCRCVIKCAFQAGDDEPTAEYVDLLRNEHAMYKNMQGRSAETGCVRCYSINHEGRYMVLEDHGVDLRALLNASLRSPELVVEGVLPAVQALHGLSIMHGDIKPANLLVQLTFQGRYIVKLCDLDCAKHVGEECEAAGLGTKHYLAPEVRVAAASAAGTLRASTAVDMFALGLVLWQVIKRSPAAALDCDNEARLDLLYSDQAQLNAHLEYPAMYRDFMERVTCLEPTHRPNATALASHCINRSASSLHRTVVREQEEKRFLKHNVEGKLESMQHEIERLRLGQLELDTRIREMLAKSAALSNMVETLIAGTHDIPTLAIILPEVPNSWADVKQPMRLLRNHYRLYFLCAHTKQIAPCGPDKKGYEIEVTRQWVQDAAPVLRVGLVLVKVALLASGLPLPVPDLCSALADTTKHCKYLDAVLHLVTHPPDDTVKGAEYVMQTALDAVEAYDENNLLADYGVTDPLKVVRLKQGTKQAYDTIKGLLEAQEPSVASNSGLRKVIDKETGRTAWVLDSDATERAWRESIRPVVPLPPAPVSPSSEAAAAPVSPSSEAAAVPVSPLSRAAAAPVSPLSGAAAAPVSPSSEVAAVPVSPLSGAAAAPVSPLSGAAAAPVSPSSEVAAAPVSPLSGAAAAPVSPSSEAAAATGRDQCLTDDLPVSPQQGVAGRGPEPAAQGCCCCVS